MQTRSISPEVMLAIPAVEISRPELLPEQPLVSVLVITYNHAPYIARCIEGVIAQQCDFPFELLIGEDCSTDNTRAICLDYQRRYPHLIRLITAERNVGMNPNDLRLRTHARGKYLAHCEGDDYWTNPRKLARQVQLMEAHPECPLSFTRFRIVRQFPDGRTRFEQFGGPAGPEQEFSFEQLFDEPIYVHVCTMMERADAVEFPTWFLRTLSADWVHILLHADKGPLRLIPEVTAVYRIHDGGVWSGTSEELHVRRGLTVNHQLDRQFQGRYRLQFNRRQTDLFLTLARIEARKHHRKAAWSTFRLAWRTTLDKRRLAQKELLKFMLAFLDTRLYDAGDRLSKKVKSLLAPAPPQTAAARFDAFIAAQHAAGNSPRKRD